MADRPMFTYQTRLTLTPEQSAVLDAWGELYGRVERSLFAAMETGVSLTELKRTFLPRFGITARRWCTNNFLAKFPLSPDDFRAK